MDKQKLAHIFKSAADYFTALHQTDYRHGFDKGYSITQLSSFANDFQDMRVNFANDKDPTILSAFMLQSSIKLTKPKHRKLWEVITQRPTYMETSHGFTAVSPFAVFAEPSINLWRDFTKNDLLSWRLAEHSFGYLQIDKPKLLESINKQDLLDYLLDSAISFRKSEITTMSIPSYIAKWLESNAFREVRIREYTINEHKFYAFATSEDFDDKDNFTTFVGFINHTLQIGNLSESDLQPVELLSDYLQG